MRSVVFVAVLFMLVLSNTIKLQAELKSTYNQADYIVIYHPEFQESIKKFVDWRENKGVNVYSVDVNEIYRDFQDTNERVDAIRDFVSYALEFWNDPKPRYLLLVGGINHIPSKRIESTFTYKNEYYVHIDDYFADVKENEVPYTIVPDIAIGRFPVRNIRQLDNMIEKTIFFEDSSYTIQYKNDFLITSDNEDYSLFENFASNIEENVLPDYLKIKRIDYRKDSYYYGNRDEFINQLNDGSIMLLNLFHGNPKIWMRDTLLLETFIDTLKLTEKPFIINAISCSQRWDDSLNESIVEKLLFKDRCGAVASFAPVGLTYAHPSYILLNQILNNIFSDSTRQIGNAIQNSKYINPSELNARFTLLGDPMLMIPNRIVAGIQNSPKNETDIQIFPNPCNSFAIIRFKSSIGEIQIEILDLLGNKIKSENYIATNGLNEYRLDASELANGTYFVQIRQGVTIHHSKVIVNK